MFGKKAIFILLILLCMTTVMLAQSKGTIVYVIRPNFDDPDTGLPPDLPIIEALEDEGYEVILFSNDALADAEQVTLDTLYNANLIVIGRSCPSLNFADPHKETWNSITVPMMCLELWALRISRMNWLNTETMFSITEEGTVYNALIEEPDDPVFEDIDVADPLPWVIAPFDAIQIDDGGYGTVLARFETDNTVVFVRFESDVEFYPNSVDYPAGPRTYIGNGRDAGSSPPFTYYNFAGDAELVFLNEVARMVELGGGGGSAVKKDVANPTSYSLAQNYPNPFNPTTNIEFTLSKAGHTTLQVFNVEGKLVTTLVDNNLSAGLHTVHFSADDLSAGIYYYTIRHDGFTDVKKMVLMK